MSLTKSEFDLLNYFRETRNITQRDMADKFSMSLGKVNKLVTDLKSKELINNTDTVYDITERGMDALKPYKVNNAIIMAAGMSSRFAPLSYERPKGLLNVKGEILIEREIRQLQEAGITDITIVVGYMKEKFFYLEEKFGAKIVVNEDYYQYNNTSTLIRVLISSPIHIYVQVIIILLIMYLSHTFIRDIIQQYMQQEKLMNTAEM